MTTPPRVAVRRLALGRVISMAGTFAAGTALNFTIYERTHSTAWLSATMLLTWGITGFFGPLAGALGDRLDRKRLMIVSEISAALCWVVMSFLLDAPAVLLGVAFVSSVLETPYFPASGAAIPNIAGSENLTWANSLIATGRYLGLTLGPLIGGLMVASVGARWVFIANAVSYVSSAVLTITVHGRFADEESRTEEAQAEHRGAAAGFRFVWNDRVLRLLAIAWVATILGLAMTLVADPPLAESFGVGSFGYGMITAAWGGGTIVGAWIARRISEGAEAVWLVICTALLGVTGFGVALAPWFGLVLFWVLVFGISDGPTAVIEQNLLQRRTPDVVRSRVMGAWETFMHAALVVSLVAGAWIVQAFGPKGAYAVGGVTGIAGAIILIPLLRWLPEPAADVGTVEPTEAILPMEPLGAPADPS